MEKQCVLFLLGLMNKKIVMELSGKEVCPSFTSLGNLSKPIRSEAFWCLCIFRDKNSCFLWRLGGFTRNSQDSSGEGQGSSSLAL